ncbi:hypothetical protein [Pontibacter pamirensis]|uniref:hypothetical protein n=1 Tax=Pontibacter pamirensis TaxID=2562824 RepID=UPI00138A1C3D|nr:hypothetical protein [Pontibacter pamirensis]
MPTERNTNEWDDEKYNLLNAHFRQKINELLGSDPYLQQAVSEGKELQLRELIDRMTAQDKKLWNEFMRLDRKKLEMDMKDHLEGKGTPYNAQRGFGNSTGSISDEEQPW